MKKTGDFQVSHTVREVVDEVFDSRLEISEDALAINSADLVTDSFEEVSR